MHERYITFDGVSTQSIGLVYSTFVETVPEPKAIYVDVPGGYPVDVSEALGGIAYGNGTHVLTFLLYASTQEDRLAAKSRIMAVFHGKRAQYTLSWAVGTYMGRASVAFEHRWDNVDVVTITIVHSPMWTDTTSYYVYTTATTKTATTASVTEQLRGAAEYTVSVRTYQLGSARLGSGSVISIDNTTANLGTVSAGSGDSIPLVISTSDWWIGTINNGKAILRSTHFPNPSNGEVTTDADWTLSGTNLVCSNYSSKQKAYITLSRKGF